AVTSTASRPPSVLVENLDRLIPVSLPNYSKTRTELRYRLRLPVQIRTLDGSGRGNHRSVGKYQRSRHPVAHREANSRGRSPPAGNSGRGAGLHKGHASPGQRKSTAHTTPLERLCNSGL